MNIIDWKYKRIENILISDHAAVELVMDLKLDVDIKVYKYVHQVVE